MPLAPKKMGDRESTSLLNLLDSLYESGLPKVESEEDAVEQLTPGQKAMSKPPMDMTPLPAALADKRGMLPKKPGEDEEEEEQVDVPANIMGSW
jgi:hypothetical protein